MRVLVAIVLVSCGGQVIGTLDDGGASKGDAAAGFDFCTAMQKRAQMCNQPFAQSACAQTRTCIDNALRSEVRDGMEQCLANQACGTNSSDACLATFAQPYENVSPFSDYAAKCAAKRAACGTWPEDYCATKYAVGTAEVTGAMSACMDLACDGIPACFASVLTSHGCQS
jgi:hypothetical protein